MARAVEFGHFSHGQGIRLNRAVLIGSHNVDFTTYPRTGVFWRGGLLHSVSGVSYWTLQAGIVGHLRPYANNGRLLTRRDEESGPLHDLRYSLLPLRSLAALTAATVLFRTIQGGSPVERRGGGGAVCGSSISIIVTMRTRWATDPACIFCLI